MTHWTTGNRYGAGSVGTRRRVGLCSDHTVSRTPPLSRLYLPVKTWGLGPVVVGWNCLYTGTRTPSTRRFLVRGPFPDDCNFYGLHANPSQVDSQSLFWGPCRHRGPFTHTSPNYCPPRGLAFMDPLVLILSSFRLLPHPPSFTFFLSFLDSEKWLFCLSKGYDCVSCFTKVQSPVSTL